VIKYALCIVSGLIVLFREFSKRRCSGQNKLYHAKKNCISQAKEKWS